MQTCSPVGLEFTELGFNVRFTITFQIDEHSRNYLKTFLSLSFLALSSALLSALFEVEAFRKLSGSFLFRVIIRGGSVAAGFVGIAIVETAIVFLLLVTFGDFRTRRVKEWASDRVGRENMTHHENMINENRFDEDFP